MSKAKAARRAAGLRNKAAKAVALATATYSIATRVDVWGGHPALVRIADGLMVPCTHSAPRRGEPVCALPSDWANVGDRDNAWAKPWSAGQFGRMAGCSTAVVTDAALVAAADAAFAVADAA